MALTWVRYKLLSFLLLGSVSLTTAQINFEHISRADGLPHNHTECIFKDSYGFMWFGTRNGLSRFDGYEMRVYRQSLVKNSISGNWILSINEDNDSCLWIGTHQSGLNKFNQQTQRFVHYRQEYGFGNQIYCIEILSDGTVCAGTNNGLAIYKKESDSFQVFYPNNTEYSINNHIISDIIQTKDGKIYIATQHRDIQRFDIKEGKFYTIKYQIQAESDNYRKRFMEDKDGNLWIAAHRHGVYRLNRETGKVKYYGKAENMLNTEALTGDMIENTDGKIWIATDDSGINVLNPANNTFKYIHLNNKHPDGLPGDHIYSLYKDNHNRIWVGLFDKGVACYDPLRKKFTNSALPDTIVSFLNSKSIISAYTDSDGDLWIGTDGNGLHCLKALSGLRSYYHHKDSANTISSNIITAIGEDKNGNILIGTYLGGLNSMDKKSEKITRFLPDATNRNAIHSSNIWSIYTDSRGKTWLGLLGNGADIYNPETATFKNIGPFSNELLKVGHPNIMCINEDNNGNIWFGSEGNGVYIYDLQKNAMTSIPDNKLKTSIIKDIFQDNKQQIWLSTEGNGLFSYNLKTKNTKQFTVNSGLPGMITLDVQQDKAGRIWVATYDGLCVLNQNSNRFAVFNTNDGLAANELNAGSFVRLNNGHFFVGSINGVNMFDPLNLKLNQSIPRIYFTQLQVLNQIVKPGDTINNHVVLKHDIAHTEHLQLKYSDKIFTLQFAALNYTLPQKCTYKYKLSGFDDKWIETSAKQRHATYSNLRKGKYILKVQASNNDGKWGNNTTEITIKILPPFWRTVWFYLLIAIVLIAIIGAFYYSRMQIHKNRFLQQQAINEKRIVELEKENIENELEKLTFYTVNRNRVLINYKNRLLTLSLKAKETVKNGLKLMIEEIDKEIADDKEWKYIEPRLDKFYDGFVTKLREKHPNLTLSEIKVATYVRMNLTSKEISEFMHKTIRAVENDRYRLRKKINLNTNDSLREYLMKLNQ